MSNKGHALFTPDALEFFRGRAIDPQVAEQAGVREDKKGLQFRYGGDSDGFWRNRRLNGDGPKVTQPKGKRLTSWWPGGVAREVLVTEGESDALAAMSALRHSPIPDLQGLPVVAIPGTGFPADRLAGQLADAGVAQAWLALDADDAGRKYVEKAIPELVGQGIRSVPVFLQEGSDLADCLASIETEAERGDWLATRLADAQTAAEEKLETAEAPAVPVGPVDTAELLDEVKTFIGRFVVLPTDEAADLLALWVLHTHAFGASWATPYLRVVSAAPGSGKTLLMEVLAAITRRGWHAINPSVAVLYRKVDRQQPTLLLDEMDNYPIDDRRDALAVLNSGYKRGAKVDRCKDNGDLEEFACYCPKVFSGIDGRALVDTLLSRSITIRMEKKIRSEQVDMWIAPLVEPDAIALRGRCEAWADQHLEALTNHGQPDLIGLLNRQAEIWWALLSIAEHAGGGWQSRARGAAERLSTGGDDSDDVSTQVQVLLDIRDAFAVNQTIFSKDLLMVLNGLEESPWGARRKGEGLDSRGLAKMLRPFGIRPRTVRVEGVADTSRGYHLDQFSDAFARHLPEATQATHPTQAAPGLERDVSHVLDVLPNPGAVDDADTLSLDVMDPEEEVELDRLRAKFGDGAA